MENYFKNKKIGIWGFGSVGKSILNFLTPFNCKISVCEQRIFDDHEQAILEGHHVQSVPYQLLPQFLEMNDIIIPSPGIDLKPFKEYQSKFLCELDIK